MGPRTPDQTEQWAQEYFCSLGFAHGEIVFEPDGNVPPYFVLRGHIAVEVRRLNQHVADSSGKPIPLDELEIPFINRLKKILAGFGPPTHGVSWYVFPRFGRPLNKNRQKDIHPALLPFQRNEIDAQESLIRIDPNLHIRMIRRAEPGVDTFILAGSSDHDSGGWVDEELHNNISICIEQKTAKIAGYRAKYSEWWLVLVDHMMGGRPAEKGPARIVHSWDKVVVIHPANYGWAYEVLNPQR